MSLLKSIFDTFYAAVFNSAIRNIILPYVTKRQCS